MARRPVWAGSADKTLSRAVEIWHHGAVKRRSLSLFASKLATVLRQDMPDCVIVRAPRTLSLQDARAGLIAYETRVVVEAGKKYISIESHAVLLREASILFVHGLLPGMTQPHLFERVLERNGQLRDFAAIQLQMSALWPTILWMRREQRLVGRGDPVTAVVTPFEGGLFFAAIEKVGELPAAGPLRAIVDSTGTRQKSLRDYYADGSMRANVMTKTFVDKSKLTSNQQNLHDALKEFILAFGDVVSENDWRWKIGLGEPDQTVADIARAFRIVMPTPARRKQAYDALELIVTSSLWRDEEARNLENQARRRTLV
ncbi:hypothetical protein AAIH70_25965 [Neorhizobium sp. BT27B]|uniref:hypothetical protein n=1 Tax=Neorhizobium sp. BT27B TaxID=3142625 RepID=UPI003D2CDCA0